MLGDSLRCFERLRWLHLRDKINKKNRPPKHMASRPSGLESSAKVQSGLQISHDVPQRLKQNTGHNCHHCKSILTRSMSAAEEFQIEWT